MTYNFNQAAEAAKQEYPANSNNTEWLTKFEIGETRIRIMSPFLVYPQHYSEGEYKGICVGKDKGCPGCAEDKKPSVKWIGWVLHDGALKVCLLPYNIIPLIGKYQDDPEYAFSDLPMPYDIHIVKTQNGPKKQNVEYSLRPARSNTDIPQNIMDEYAKANKPEEIIKAVKDKKLKELGHVDTSNEDTRVVPDEAYAEHEAQLATEESVEIPTDGDFPF